MSDFKMEMRLLNTRHFACSAFGVGNLIFSESIFTVEHHRPASGGEQTFPRGFGGGRRRHATFLSGRGNKQVKHPRGVSGRRTQRTHARRLKESKRIQIMPSFIRPA